MKEQVAAGLYAVSPMCELQLTGFNFCFGFYTTHIHKEENANKCCLGVPYTSSTLVKRHHHCNPVLFAYNLPDILVVIR